MQSSLPLLLSAVLAIAPLAGAQTIASPSTTASSAASPAAASGTIVREPSEPAESQQPAGAPSASAASGTIVHKPTAVHSALRSRKRSAHAARATGTARASPPAGASDGVLSLGATDITGNKELPKVMVIVPWKDSLGAGGVIKPTDSLMDEVLQPVDRGVFQRRIRYYGQLDAAGQPAAASRVAPVGDSH